MVDGIKPLLPAPLVRFGRSYAKPLIVSVALTALAFVVWMIARSLRDRVQPKDPEDLLTKGDTAFNDQDYPQAIQKFTAALQNSPDSLSRAKIFTSRAESYSKIADTTEEDKLDNQKKALSDFKEALDCEPKDSELLIRIYYGMGDILFQRGDYAAALIEYTNAEFCKPQDDDFKAKLFYKKGLTCFFRGFFADAIEEFVKADNCESSDPHLCAETLVYLARAYRSSNIREKNQQALEALSKALKFQTDDVNLTRSIYLERATIHVEMENNLQAIDDLNKALTCEPMSNEERIQILVRRGSLRYAVGYKDAARIDFKAAWNLYPTDPNIQAELWRYAAKFNVDENNPAGALNALNSAIGCNPTQGLDLCFLERGRVLVHIAFLDEAINDFSNGIEIASNEETKALLYLARGDTHFKRNDSKAKQDWEKALECQFTNETLRKEIAGRFAQYGF